VQKTSRAFDRGAPGVRIVHVSDIHFWQYALNPLRLMSKRVVGMAALALGRARRFQQERAGELVERVKSLNPDHVLITGDLTTTALPAEFRAARAALAAWLHDPAWITIIPGNHDRYTRRAHRSRRFEEYFGAFAGGPDFPWLRRLDTDTAILALDPTRAGISAHGLMGETQLARAEQLLARTGRIARLVVACHYPVGVPLEYRREYARKPLVDAGRVVRWLATIGPHLFCCGHVHAAWAICPEGLPNQLSLCAGAPLLRDRGGRHTPGFLEIILDRGDVTVMHHAWAQSGWQPRLLHQAVGFFAEATGR
jgi:3',5'-cyclic AMP phosphodiesterase CpdA